MSHIIALCGEVSENSSNHSHHNYIQQQLNDYDKIVNNEYDKNLKLLRDYFKTEVNEIQLELWNFLIQNNITLSSVSNWGDYRRAAEVSSDKEIRRIAEKSPAEDVDS
jgi:hypothetical protein